MAYIIIKLLTLAGIIVSLFLWHKNGLVFEHKVKNFVHFLNKENDTATLNCIGENIEWNGYEQRGIPAYSEVKIQTIKRWQETHRQEYIQFFSDYKKFMAKGVIIAVAFILFLMLLINAMAETDFLEYIISVFHL